MRYILLLFLFCITSLSYTHDWYERSTGSTKDLLSASAPDDSVVWACGKEGTILLSTSGGQAWRDMTGSAVIGNKDLLNIFAINANNVLVTASPETDPNTHETTTYIYRTTDRGGAWKQVFSQKGTQGLGIFMFDGRHGLFYANPIDGKWQIWLTSDSGKTWDSTGVRLMTGSPAEKSRPNSFDGNQDFRIFRFGTNNSRYYETLDYGKTWKTIVVPGSGNINAVAFSSDSGYARQYGLVAGTGLYRTLDSGKTWQNMTSYSLGKGEIISMIQHDFWEIIIIRESPEGNPQYSLYQSSNFGEDPWNITFSAPDKNEYTYLADAREGGWLFCIRKGGGLTVGQHKFDPIFTNLKHEAIANPGGYYLGQNFPNPFNPSTTINYSIPWESFVELKVYDILGREVSTLVSQVQNEGKHEVQFEASGLPGGIYIYALRAGNYKASRKLLFLK
ncbi:MAG TPA: T9SS type A sorting domain-containing protein [Ignavibacteriales bacterium]|nr:T9SS type A sorting domain-containing protein [Ignavibacteriales bacterium]